MDFQAHSRHTKALCLVLCGRLDSALEPQFQEAPWHWSCCSYWILKGRFLWTVPHCFRSGERRRRNAHPCVSCSAIVRSLVDEASIETVIPENEVLLQRNVWTWACVWVPCLHLGRFDSVTTRCLFCVITWWAPLHPLSSEGASLAAEMHMRYWPGRAICTAFQGGH